MVKTTNKRHVLRTPSDLIQAGLASEADRATLHAVSSHFATAIPPAFQALIETSDDPIGKQVIPNVRELTTQPYETVDPIGMMRCPPSKGSYIVTKIVRF